MKKILYLGENNDFIQNLERSMKKSFNDCEIIIDHNTSTPSSFEAIDLHKPSIVLLSTSAEEELGRSFFILVQKVFGRIPFVVITPSKEIVVSVEKLSTLGDYLYWIESPVLDEVIDYISKMLNLGSKKPSDTKKAFYKDNFEIYQCMRVVQMGRNNAVIETNRYFENNTIIPMKFPYHEGLFNSNRHKVTGRTTNGVGSHYKYKYNLEYVLNSKTMELAEKRQLINNYRYELGQKVIDEEIFLAVIEATKKKTFSVIDDKKNEILDEEGKSQKELNLLSRTLYFNWFYEETRNNSVIQNTISIYDRKKTLLHKGLEANEKELISAVHRKEIKNLSKDILVDIPSFIIVHLDEINTVEELKIGVASVTLLQDQFPFIIVFNYKGDLDAEGLRAYLEYHFVIISPSAPDPTLIKKMLQIYRVKKDNKEILKYHKILEELKRDNPDFIKFKEDILLDHKVYKNIEDPSSLLVHSEHAQVVWMSDTEINFRTNVTLEVGEIFRLTKPFDFQIEILETQIDKSNPRLYNYTAHMHLLTLTDRMTIKGFTKEISTFNAKGKELEADQLQALKDRYFPFNFVYNL